MIKRYDAYSEGQDDDGRFVFYEEHLAELQPLIEKAADFLGTDKGLWSVGCIEAALVYAKHLREEVEKQYKEIANLKKDLALNASMLARQCDLAREAETEAKRLRNALIEITDYPEERMTCEIAEEALKEQP